MSNHNGAEGSGIDLAREAVLSFKEAARYVGGLKGTNGLSFQTLFRWATKGCRGVVLETICLGGSRCTSKEALHRFFGGVTAAQQRACDAPPTRAVGPTLPFPDLGDVDRTLRDAGIVEPPGDAGEPAGGEG